jgi:tRNA G18 (ribose-2'-O)-methylase SpoU
MIRPKNIPPMSKQNDEYIFGYHPVQHLLQQDSSRIIEVWAQVGRHDEKLQSLLDQLQQQFTVQYAPKKTLDKLASVGCISKASYTFVNLNTFGA